MAPDAKPSTVVPEPADLDSLHILPLAMIPLETAALRRARMVKNSRLSSMVELFRDRTAGSGQVEIKDVPLMLPEEDGEGLRADLRKLEKLSRIPSFDVYSIRIALRHLDFDVESAEYLKLSDDKRGELSERMASFTRPLVQHVFGSDGAPIEDAADLSKLLRNPDKEEAMRRLNQMARKLDVKILEIPKFVEDYGDIFLSLAYFQSVLDDLIPKLDRFLYWLNELRSNWTIKNDRAREKVIAGIVNDLGDVSGSVTGRFENFDRQTKDFWQDINGDRFREVRRLITAHHRAVAGMLCGLTLKMDSWKERFPDPNIGGPQTRIEFTFSEVLPGMEMIKRLTKE